MLEPFLKPVKHLILTTPTSFAPVVHGVRCLNSALRGGGAGPVLPYRGSLTTALLPVEVMGQCESVALGTEEADDLQ